MTKPSVTLRNTKASALTYNELDTNFTNLRDATISVTDGVNTAVLDLNDTLTLSEGDGITLSVDAATDTVTINAANDLQNTHAIAIGGDSSDNDPDYKDKGIQFDWVDTSALKTITVSNDVIMSTTQKVVGTKSFFFEFDSGDPTDNPGYLTVASSSDFAFGTGDFTLECWVRRPSGLGAPIYFLDFNTSNSPAFVPRLWIEGSTNKIAYYVDGGNYILSTNTVANDTWTHLAVVRSSGTTTLYMNGTSQGSFSDSFTYVAGPCNIASNYSGGTFSNGYMDEIHISKGVARYTGNFTPSTSRITPDANTVLLLHAEGAVPTDDSLGTGKVGFLGWNHDYSAFTIIPDSSADSGVYTGTPGNLKVTQSESNTVQLVPGSTPSSPSDGMIYYDSSTNKFRGYVNGSWVDLH